MAAGGWWRQGSWPTRRSGGSSSVSIRRTPIAVATGGAVVAAPVQEKLFRGYHAMHLWRRVESRRQGHVGLWGAVASPLVAGFVGSGGRIVKPVELRLGGTEKGKEQEGGSQMTRRGGLLRRERFRAACAVTTIRRGGMHRPPPGVWDPNDKRAGGGGERWEGRRRRAHVHAALALDVHFRAQLEERRERGVLLHEQPRRLRAQVDPVLLRVALCAGERQRGIGALLVGRQQRA